MNKTFIKFVYFLAVAINSITSIINFVGKNTSWGFVHLFLAIAFLVMGVIYAKNNK